jgi:hypothetical protein
VCSTKNAFAVDVKNKLGDVKTHYMPLVPLLKDRSRKVQVQYASSNHINNVFENIYFIFIYESYLLTVNILSSSLLSKSIKIKIQRTIILYGCET